MPYAVCCKPLHHGDRQAPTAEALMRSRYSAYALGLTAYILSSWHPSTRPATFQQEPGLEWYMLKIEAASQDGDQGTVTFSARSRLLGHTHTLREVSRFVREGGRWYYVDGLTSSGDEEAPPSKRV